MYETIKVRQDERGVATLSLARAQKHNALSAVMLAELTAAAAELGTDPAVRVVILAAEGRSFCAGGDLGWMREQLAANPETRLREARKLADMLMVLNTLPKPLIGRVQGNAFGGGIGLMCVCDVVIAAEGARFGLTETRLGLIPATIGPYVLARIGEGGARRVFMSARLFDAPEARDLGLVARIAPEGTLDALVEAEVAPYLNCAPGAVAAAKAHARALGQPINDAVIDQSIRALARCWELGEAQEGIAAFFDKRPPRWGA